MKKIRYGTAPLLYAKFSTSMPILDASCCVQMHPRKFTEEEVIGIKHWSMLTYLIP